MLAEGTLPPGYIVKKRRLIKVDTAAGAASDLADPISTDPISTDPTSTDPTSTDPKKRPTKKGKKKRKKGKKKDKHKAHPARVA